MFVRRLYWRLTTKLYFWRLRRANRGRSVEDIFTGYWRTNHWGYTETKSGQGSTLAYTVDLRRELPRLLQRHHFTSILDLPCGDFHWMSNTDLPAGVRYIGGDIVRDMVEELNRRHASTSHCFAHIDAVSGRLPEVDVWMCRDLIFHLPTADVFRLIDNFVDSNIRYLLITSHDGPHVKNDDTFAGGFRFINLLEAPFLLPFPIERVADYVAPHPPRHLLLYSRESLAEWQRGSQAAEGARRTTQAHTQVL